MGTMDFFKSAGPVGGYTRVRQFPVTSGATGWTAGVPLVISGGFVDISGSNPAAADVVGISQAQSADVNGVQFGTAGYIGQKLAPVAVKTMEDEWVCHNWVATGGVSGTGVAPTIANAMGVQAGIYFGVFTLSATDIRATQQGLTTVAATFAVDATAAVTVKHFVVVRVLDSLFRDISVSGGTGEYVVVRWLNVAQ